MKKKRTKEREQRNLISDFWSLIQFRFWFKFKLQLQLIISLSLFLSLYSSSTHSGTNERSVGCNIFIVVGLLQNLLHKHKSEKEDKRRWFNFKKEKLETTKTAAMHAVPCHTGILTHPSCLLAYLAFFFLLKIRFSSFCLAF